MFRKACAFAPQPPLVAGENAKFHIVKRFKGRLIRCIIESYKWIGNISNFQQIGRIWLHYLLLLVPPVINRFFIIKYPFHMLPDKTEPTHQKTANFAVYIRNARIWTRRESRPGFRGGGRHRLEGLGKNGGAQAPRRFFNILATSTPAIMPNRWPSQETRQSLGSTPQISPP